MKSPAPDRFEADSNGGCRPLEPFEQLMLADDRPGHPMRFFLEFTIRGPLRPQRLREAVATAARRHPRLCSRVGFRRGRAVWLEPDVLPAVVWNPAAWSASPWRPCDLRRESGLKIVVLEVAADLHRVVMQVHHATCDGIAACEVAGDIWSAYAGIEPRRFSAGRSGGSEPSRELPPPEAPASEAPASEAPASEALSSGGPALPPAIPPHDIAREAWAFASFWPAAIARRGNRRGRPARVPSDPRSPPYARLDFDRAGAQRLRTAATAAGLSLNDLVVAAAMRAAAAWNVGAGRYPGNVRVTMPVNMRPPGQREPARNSLGYAFLDRTAAACDDRRALAASIGAASRWIQENNAGSFFLTAIGGLARWPALLRLVTRLPVCISTMVVSNIGDPSRRMRAGVTRIDGRDAPADLLIEGCIGVPPLRPLTRAAIGVTSYAGGLSLCCLCSADEEPRAGAEAFLTLIAHELEQLPA